MARFLLFKNKKTTSKIFIILSSLIFPPLPFKKNIPQENYTATHMSDLLCGQVQLARHTIEIPHVTSKFIQAAPHSPRPSKLLKQLFLPHSGDGGGEEKNPTSAIIHL